MPAPALTTIFTPDRAVQSLQAWSNTVIRFLDRWDLIPKLIGRIDTNGSGQADAVASFGLAFTQALVDSNLALEVTFGSPMIDAKYIVLASVGVQAAAADRIPALHLLTRESFRMKSYVASTGTNEDLSTVSRQFTFGVWGRLESGA